MRRTVWMAMAISIVAGAGIVPAANGATFRSVGPTPYIDPSVNRFVLYANSRWDVAGGGGSTRQFNAPAATVDDGYAIAGGDVPKYIWAPTCSEGKQTVTFRRTVWLPGPTQDLEFDTATTFVRFGNYVWNDPLSSIKLVINGTVVGKISGTGNSDVSISSPSLLNSIKYGDNVFQVVVQKKANPAYVKTCDGQTAAKRLGIQFGIIGSTFPADLAVIQPPDVLKTVYRHFMGGQKYNWTYNFTLKNDGPAASRTGRFEVLVQSGFMKLSNLAVTRSTPLGPCTYPSPAQAVCPLDDWFGPGHTIFVTVSFTETAPGDPGASTGTQAEQATIDWGLETTMQPDPNSQNNTARAIRTYCGNAGSTDYNCNDPSHL